MPEPTEALGARDSRVRRVRRLLEERSARRSEDAFVVEGLTVLRSALESGVELEAIFAAPAADDACPELLAAAARKGIRVWRMADGVLERVAGTVTPQPVLAVARRRAWRLDELAGADLVVVGIDTRDPGNAGTLLRSAEAAGAGGVVFCRGSVDVTNPKVVRASAGAVFHVPVVEAGDPPEVLAVLGEMGLVRLATAARGGERPDRADLTRPVAFVVGNESHGVPEAVMPHVDGVLTIPMTGRAESLNVGVAASILLYEARRQRGPA